MNLLLDIGNTSIAWAVHKTNKILQTGSFFYDAGKIEKSILNQLSSFADATSVLVSSVLSQEKTIEITDLFQLKWNCMVWQAKTTSEFSGLKNSYKNPEQMGVDRWLNMIAARAEFNNHLILIDCGTAMTIDIVKVNGQHAGGFILPGLMMIQDTLISNTNRIKVDSNTTGIIEPANNTQDAISNGAMISLVASIENVFNRFIDNNEKTDCVITGGDASQVMRNLSINYVHRPMLIFDGLLMQYEASI